ncbi:MAG: SCO family protein, partial [Burkholderiaceae bacterium]
MRVAEPASPERRRALRRLSLAGCALSRPLAIGSGRAADPVGVALVAAAIGHRGPARAADAWLPAPALPDVALLDHRGQPQRLVSDVIRDRVVLVHFFFTGCGTVCPPQTALLRDLRQRIDAGAPARRPLFVGLSVDPLGDGPEQLRAYLSRFDIVAGLAAAWVWLTGEPASLGRGL